MVGVDEGIATTKNRLSRRGHQSGFLHHRRRLLAIPTWSRYNDTKKVHRVAWPRPLTTLSFMHHAVTGVIDYTYVKHIKDEKKRESLDDATLEASMGTDLWLRSTSRADRTHYTPKEK